MALRIEEINKVALVVFSDNTSGNNFWQKLGFIEREDLVYRNISINFILYPKITLSFYINAYF